MKFLETFDLTKIYGKGNLKVNALNGVSISVDKGEMVSIIGKSGSGKSTLLHILGALDRPTLGDVLLNGNSVFLKTDDQLSEFRRRELGFVFQSFNLLDEYNVKDNILMPLILDGRKPDRKYLEDLTVLLDINEKLKSYPDELSGGQVQRVAIARSLINRPSLILADEPTGNLDQKTGRSVLDLFRKLNREFGQTIIIVTHDLSIAKETDRIIHISDGKVSDSMEGVSV